jgi:hypothetical protein
MTKLRYAFKSINVFNFLLLLAVAAAVYNVIIPFMNLNIKMTMPAIGKSVPGPAEYQEIVQIPKHDDFVPVEENNLFHPERRIPPEKKVENAPAVIPKPDLSLFGTLISDTISIAYIEDRKAPYSTPGRGKRQTQLKKGDSISGYVLQDIEHDRIVLVNGVEKLVVLLQDKGKIRSSGTPAASLAATSVGASAAPGSLPPAAPPLAAPPASTGLSAASPAGATSPTTTAVPSPAQNTGGVPPALAPQRGWLPGGGSGRGRDPRPPYGGRPIPNQ